MKKARKRKNTIPVIIAIILFFIAVALFYYYFPSPSKTQATIVNQGIGVEAVVVNKEGQVVRSLQPTNINVPLYSIVSPGGGFTNIDNINTFLAIRSQLDNSKGNSDVTISNVHGTIVCDPTNTNPSCSSLPNPFGNGAKECVFNSDGTINNCPTNDGNGAIDAVYASRLPLVLKKGEIDSITTSEPIKVNTIEVGSINFILNITIGSFRDQNGVQQTLIGKYGSILLNIKPNTCPDGTTADLSYGTNETISCSVPTKGKYCAISNQGNPTLVDKASFCGCPTGFNLVGETCSSQSCTPNSCIPGTINYCLSDGKTVEARCNQCALGLSHLDYCGLNSYSNSATGCVSTTDPSTCSYPAVSSSGFTVQVLNNAPSVPLNVCGDGVKSGTEQCDGSDFGGVSCSSPSVGATGGVLQCTSTCTYDTSKCVFPSINTQFRVANLTYSSYVGDTNSWIAWSDSDKKTFTCGGVLTGYGSLRVAGVTGTATCSARLVTSGGALLLSNLPHDPSFHIQQINGNSILGLYRWGPNLFVCEDSSGGSIQSTYIEYATSYYASTTPAVTDTQGASVDPTREVKC